MILLCTSQNLEGFLLKVPAVEIRGIESKFLPLYFKINVACRAAKRGLKPWP